uniref:Peripla_BP_1 domain-containing protein n=1 Tax=Steinernema glaseri TaxID=37863 RepID=A0A1I7YIE5_9BILA
ATIGLLVPNSVNPYFAELARGIEDGCERNGYCVILCNSDDDPRKQRSYLRVLLEKRIDGLIVASVGEEADLLDSLASVRTPMVIVDRALAGVDADLVRIDHEQGAYLATRHLLELGHQDIACINGPAHTSVAKMRLAGFHRALAQAGMSQYVYPALTTVGQSIRELGEMASELLLRRIGEPQRSGVEQRIVAPSIVLRESTGPRPELFND